MGYYSNLSGEIEISPPLTWGQIKDSLYTERSYDPCVYFDILEDTVETNEGSLTRKSTCRLIPYDDDGKYYNFVDDVKKAIIFIRAQGSLVRGWIVRFGETNGDLERVGVSDWDGTLCNEQATFYWPDGSNAAR